MTEKKWRRVGRKEREVGKDRKRNEKEDVRKIIKMKDGIVGDNLEGRAQREHLPSCCL
jgi:hypothetical protein